MMGMPGAVGPVGPSGANGAPGANGAAGMNGKHAFANLTIVSGNGGPGVSGHAECPAGQLLVGWGFDGHEMAGMVVSATGITAVKSRPQAICLQP